MVKKPSAPPDKRKSEASKANPGFSTGGLEELEPRILLSTLTLQDVDGADADGVLEQQLSAEDVARLAGRDTVEAFEAEEGEAIVARRELVVIDEGVGDYDALLNDLLASAEAGRELEVVVLSSERDGIDQISDFLNDYQGLDRGLDAIHIISHGAEAGVQLGNAWLSNDTLSQYEDRLAGWSQSLSEDADLLFYGCDLAGGESGESFVGSIAKLTGADVAASDDLTGAALLGGDWDLEFKHGEVETASALSVGARQSYAGTLTVATFQQGVDGYAGTLDTELYSSNPTTPLGSQATIVTDADNAGGVSEGLLQFGDLFGTGPGQIPPGSTITSATLTLDVVDTTADPEVIGLHRMLVGWDEASTWDSLGGGIQLDDTEATATADATVPDTRVSGAITLTGLESTVQAWSDGAENHGWAVITTTNDGWDFSSSEAATAGTRPRLTVEYVAPGLAPTDLQTTASTGGGLSINEDGGNDAYLIADDGSALLGGLTQFTIETQFSASNPPTSNYQDFVSYATSSQDEEIWLALHRNSGTDFEIQFAVNGVIETATGYNAYPLFDGDEHSVSVTWDSAGGAYEIFVDGVSVHADTGLKSGYTIQGGGELTLVRDQDSPGGGFDLGEVFQGTLHDLRIFDDVRTDTEIRDFRTVTLPSNEAGLIANWTFDELSESGVLVDTVGGNNLTIQNVGAGGGYLTSTPELTLAVRDSAPSGTVIGRVAGVDADVGDTLTYSMTDDSGGRFAVDAVTGEITVADDTLLDYASATTHDVTVRVTDSASNTYDEVLSIRLKSTAGDAVVTGDTSYTGNEGDPVAGDLDATDPDGLTDTTYFTVSSGATYGTAVIDAETGAWSFTPSAPDWFGTDSFVVTVTDDAGGTTRQTIEITLAGISDAPIISYASGSATLPENYGPLILAPSATVSDADSADFDGGQLVTRVATNGAAEDVLTVRHQGTGAGQVGVNGSEITYGGLVVGSFDGPVSGATPLTITFNSNATSGIVQAVTRNVTYENISDAPSSSWRTIEGYLSDGDGGTSLVSSGTIRTVPADDAASFSGDTSYSGNEDDPVTGDLDATDVEGLTDGTYFSISADAVHGTASIDPETGVWTFTPTDVHWFGSDSFEVTVTDDLGGTTTQLISITVASVNDAPVRTAGTVADLVVLEDSGLTSLGLGGLAYGPGGGTDESSQTLTYEVTTIPSPEYFGTIYLADGTTEVATGFYSLTDLQGMQFAPAADENGGPAFFSFRVTDSGGTSNGGADSTVETMRLDITPVNDAPTANDDTASVNEGASVLIDLTGNDTDVDDSLDPTSIVITSGPGNGSLVDNGDGTFTYTHDGSETLGDSFSYTIDDASGATSNVANVTLTVTPQNDAPTAADDTASVNEGASVLIDLAGNDTDPDNALDLSSIVITSGPANGTLLDNGDGTLTYTHDGSETIGDSFSYTIDDASGATSNVANVTLTVTPQNDAPTAADDTASVNEGGSVSIDLAGNDTDPDNALDFGSIVITSGPANGTLLDHGDGTFTYTHDGSETLGDSFSYTIDDASGATSNVANVTLTVTPQNDAPTAADDTASVNEGASVLIDLAGNDTDPDNALDLGSIVITSGPANGTLLDNGDGTLTYTHDGSETIGDSFSYTIDDASGATSNVANVTLTVTPQNDAPTAADDTASVNEGASVLIDLSSNDSDPDNALDFGSIVITSGPANGTLLDNGDGTLTYTHDGSETIGDSFSYTIDDASGATSNVANVTLTVTPQNDAPTAADDTASVNEGGSVSIDLAGNDTDPDNALDFGSIVITSGPASGTLLDNGDGTFTYTHDGSETLGDSFSYTIDDASGATSNVANVTLAVTPQNDAPTVDLDADDSAALGSDYAASWTEGGGPVAIADADASIADVDDSNLASLTISIENLRDVGQEVLSADLTGTSIVANYDASLGVLLLSGSDSVTNYQQVLRTIRYDSTSDTPDSTPRTIRFVANDGETDSPIATTTLAIATTNDVATIATSPGSLSYIEQGAPIEIDDALMLFDPDGRDGSDPSADFSATVRITGNYSGDDVLGFAETAKIVASVSGDELLLSVRAGETASVADFEDALRSVTFSNGSDAPSELDRTISFTFDDGLASSVAATRTLQVVAQNDAPTAVDDTGNVLEGGTLRIDLAANDTDPDDGLDLASIVIVSGPSSGTLVLNGDGSVDYTHDGSETLADAFTYTIEDRAGETSNTVTVDLAITAQNDRPILVDNALTISEGGSVVLDGADLSASDAETADDQLLFTVSGVGGGQFEAVADPGVAITTFSQLQIANGEIKFVHDGGESAPTYLVTVSDGDLEDGPLAAAVSFTNVNDAPVLDLDADDSTTVGTGFDSAFEARGAPVSIADGDASIGDVDSGQLVGLNVTIANLLDPGAEWLAADTTGTSIVANYDPGSGVLTLSGDDSRVNYQQVLRTITYQNTAFDPDPSTRTIVFVADDGFDLGNAVEASVAITELPPTAVDDTATLDEGATLVIDLAGNDVDPEGALDPASIEIVGAPANGSVTLQGDGTVRYVHDGSETTSDRFDYTIRDATGKASGIATVWLNVDPVNDAPVATNVVFGASEDVPLSISAGSGVVSTSSDAEGTTLTAQLVSGPSSASSFTLRADGSFDYQATADFNGSDQFSYVVSDGEAISNVAFVTLDVVPVNDAPVLTTNQGMTIASGLSGVLSADELASVDVDDAASQILYEVTVGPSSGRLILDSAPEAPVTRFSQADIDAGRVSFAFDGVASTTDAFSFVVRDAAGATVSEATFDVSLTLGFAPEEIAGIPQDSAEPETPETPEIASDPIESEPSGGPESEASESGDGSSEIGTGSGGGVRAREAALVQTRISFGAPSASALRVEDAATPIAANREADSDARRDESIRPVASVDPSVRLLGLEQQIVALIETMREDAAGQSESTKSELSIWVSRSESVVMAFGLGIVTQVLRGGSLLAISAASMPLWRGFDPVAVLAINDQDRRERNDEIRMAERLEDDTDRVGRILDEE